MGSVLARGCSARDPELQPLTSSPCWIKLLVLNRESGPCCAKPRVQTLELE